MAQARLEMLGATIRAEHQREFPDAQGWRPRVIPLQHDFVGRVQPLLLVLLCAVGAVLLIACANVANLLLARASARAREFAIRGALGATRTRLVRQLLTESLVLAAAGGLLGVLTARYLLAGLTVLVPAGLPRAAEITIDGRVLAFTAALSLLTGVLFGVWPALSASPSHAYDTLKDSTRSVTAGLRRTRVRGALVIAEFALALVLLVTAALLVRSFVSLYRVDTGFSADHVLTSKLWMPQPNDPATGPYFRAGSAQVVLPDRARPHGGRSRRPGGRLGESSAIDRRARERPLPDRRSASGNGLAQQHGSHAGH